MNEALFQFIWASKALGAGPFHLVDGRKVDILHPGFQHLGAGPDFFHAKIRIDGLLWAGNVELHLEEKGWREHRHHIDPAYENVILHVVLKAGAITLTALGRTVPVLEVGDFLPHEVVSRYAKLMLRHQDVPCAALFQPVHAAMLDELAPDLWIQRLHARADQITALVGQLAGDWHTALCIWVTRTLGGPQNADGFEWVGRQLPWSRLWRCRGDADRVEAHVFGAAGFLLGKAKDEYHATLQREFALFGNPPKMTFPWQWGGVRPGAYPTVRLAMLSALVAGLGEWWEWFVHPPATETWMQQMQLPLRSYWQTHVDFGKQARRRQTAHIPQSLLQHLLVNVALPFQFAYARWQGHTALMQDAAQRALDVKPSKHYITEVWKSLGWKVSNAQQEQAAIHLFKQFCTHKKCLSCALGKHMLQSSEIQV